MCWQVLQVHGMAYFIVATIPWKLCMNVFNDFCSNLTPSNILTRVRVGILYFYHPSLSNQIVKTEKTQCSVIISRKFCKSFPSQKRSLGEALDLKNYCTLNLVISDGLRLHFIVFDNFRIISHAIPPIITSSMCCRLIYIPEHFIY